MKNGGPAFARPWSLDTYGDRPSPVLEQSGMTLRDWFAGQAVRAFINQCDDDDDWPYLAKKAYEMADAMLAERDKQ